MWIANEYDKTIENLWSHLYEYWNAFWFSSDDFERNLWHISKSIFDLDHCFWTRTKLVKNEARVRGRARGGGAEIERIMRDHIFGTRIHEDDCIKICQHQILLIYRHPDSVIYYICFSLASIRSDTKRNTM